LAWNWYDRLSNQGDRITITKFKVSGKEFVVVPREEYDPFEFPL
jgi:hypothetical protein